MEHCPCGSHSNYSDCCGLYISGQQIPPTPEALMRSRYTAYTQVNIEYIARTMRGPILASFNPDETQAWALQVKWLGLTVLSTSTQGDKGYVEFRASYAQNSKQAFLHEHSEFQREHGVWFYVGRTEGTNRPYQAPSQVGRNDPCPCGSTKKYKKCCGK